MTLLIEALRLTLFPAMMAFAACSDLLTMTIANKVSLALLAGFAVLAAMTGMSAAELGGHAGAAGVVLVAAFICFARGWIGGGDA
jgi:prepilin peptidase CpaA